MGHEFDIYTGNSPSWDEKQPAENSPADESYDSGYEHSWQHWVAVKELVDDAD